MNFSDWLLLGNMAKDNWQIFVGKRHITKRPSVFILARSVHGLFFESNVTCISEGEFNESVFAFTRDDYDMVIGARNDAPLSFKHGARIIFNNGEIQTLATIDAIPHDISALLIDALSQFCAHCITRVQYRPNIMNVSLVNTSEIVRPNTIKNHKMQGQARDAREARHEEIREALRMATMRRKYTIATRLNLEQCARLREIARDMNIKGRSQMNKCALIHAICSQVVNIGAQFDTNLYFLFVAFRAMRNKSRLCAIFRQGRASAPPRDVKKISLNFCITRFILFPVRAK